MRLSSISQSNNKYRGFTLVELIVVIVILAILATIAFLSFSSQSSAARDSKRATDIAGIAAKINVVEMQGVSILAMAIDNSKSLSSGILAGYDLSTPILSKYKAGLINYSLIGLKASDFSDPDGAMYPVGVTGLLGIQLQLAAKTENDSNGNATTNGAIFNGNYVPRKIEPKNIVNSDTGVLVIPDNTIGYFFIGDIVSVGSKLCEIKRLSSDKTKISLVLPGTETICDVKDNTTVILNGTNSEVASLINGKNPGPVVSGINPPY